MLKGTAVMEKSNNSIIFADSKTRMMNLRKILFVFAALSGSLAAFGQEVRGGIEIDYNAPKKYIVGGVGVEGKDPVVQNILLVALRHRDAGHAQREGSTPQGDLGGPGAAVRLADDALVVHHGGEGSDEAAVAQGDALGKAEDGRFGTQDIAHGLHELQGAVPAFAAVQTVSDVVVGIELQIPQGQGGAAHIDAGGDGVIGADEGQTIVPAAGDDGVLIQDQEAEVLPARRSLQAQVVVQLDGEPRDAVPDDIVPAVIRGHIPVALQMQGVGVRVITPCKSIVDQPGEIDLRDLSSRNCQVIALYDRDPSDVSGAIRLPHFLRPGDVRTGIIGGQGAVQKDVCAEGRGKAGKVYLLQLKKA